MTDTPPTRWCLSRRDGAVCTRAIGHAGLHNRNGTSLMWSDREQDEPGCRGSGGAAQPAPLLDDGFPAGRALCPVCLGFVRLTDAGTLWRHDAFRGARSDREASRRADWFNAFGWEG